MTNDDLNKRLAELLGWSEFYYGGRRLRGRAPGGHAHTSELVPDYCHDLNACHAVEKGRMDWSIYRRNLEEIVKESDPCRSALYIISATAKQRTEALIRTLEGTDERDVL